MAVWILTGITLAWMVMLYERLRGVLFFYPDHPMTNFIWSSLTDAIKGVIAWLVVAACIYFATQTDILSWISRIIQSQ